MPDVAVRIERQFSAAMSAAILWSSTSVFAQEPLRVNLEYQAPAGVGCPGELDFRSAVVGLLEYDPFVVGGTTTVSVEIASTDGSLGGLLQWRDAAGVLEGERRFAAGGEDCAKLAKNMAFAVTVQLQLLSARRVDTPASEAPRVESRAEPETPPPSPPPPSSTATTRPLELGAGAGPFVAFGWTPGLVPGANAFLAARNQSLSAQLGFEMSLVDRAIRDNGRGFETLVLAASVTPCLRFQGVEACSVFRFGQVQVRGFGVDEPRTPRTMFSELGLRLGLAQALGETFEGKTHAEVGCTLSPWKVELNGTETFTAPYFVFLMGFDLVAFFL